MSSITTARNAIVSLAACALLAGCGGGASSILPSTGSPIDAQASKHRLPSPSPSATPSPSPSVTPSSGSSSTLTDTTYTSIVNGQAWPSSFRPYGSTGPWNVGTANATVDQTNTANLHSSTYVGSAKQDYINDAGSNDFSHPVYLASTSDPSIAINCGSYSYGCNTSFPSTINIPAKARPALGSDHHMGVIEPDGTEYDFWNASYNGSTLSAGIGAMSSITGSGVPSSESATSGASLAAGLIRFSELSSGVIPHALFLVVPCTNGVVYPGTTTAAKCSNGGIPVGAWIYLNLTDAQIDALPSTTAPSYLLPILHALHQYGGFVEDTGGTGDIEYMYEDAEQYAAFGQSYPGDSFAVAHGYAYNSGGQEYSGPGINWPALSQYLEVLNHP